MRFFSSLVEIFGDGEDGLVIGVWVVKNELVDGCAVLIGEESVIACGLVLRLIGYCGVPVVGILFDEKWGLIVNEGGCVIGVCGEYVVGWIKCGLLGVIGINKKDAVDIVVRILEDVDVGALNEPMVLFEVFEGAVTWEGWCAIDEYEISAGEP